jgi:hypothetical protein
VAISTIRLALICFALLLPARPAVFAAVKGPAPGVLGVSLGMTEEAARKLLRRLGEQKKETKKEEEEEGGEEEVWNLTRDPRYASVIVGFDRRHRVRYVTAFAREGGRRVRYGDVGDVKGARREGDGKNYRYTWEVAAKGGRPGYLAIARGADPQYLSSYSVKRVE